MENNEIMNEGIETMMEEVVADDTTGIGTGVAVLIGAGLTLAVCAGFKLAKKAYAAYKAKKELRQPDNDVYAEAEDIDDVATK